MKKLRSKKILYNLERRALALANFNWTGNYDPDYIRSYLKAPNNHSEVIKIRLDLDAKIMRSRDAIYNTCVVALRDNAIFIKCIEAFVNPTIQKFQNLIIFDMIKK